LPNFARLKARGMTEYSSCTWPPCLTIVADMLETYKKLFAASNRKLQLSPQQSYTTPQPPVKCLNTVLSTHGELEPSRAEINSSRGSPRTPVIQYIVCWPPPIAIWSYWHLIAWRCLLLLHPVLCTVYKSVSWAICSVAAIAALRWTNWCLCRSCVPARVWLEEAPDIRLDLDWDTSGRAVFGSMTCCCRNSKEDDNEKWTVLRNR
jgi:hypothetical protein